MSVPTTDNNKEKGPATDAVPFCVVRGQDGGLPVETLSSISGMSSGSTSVPADGNWFMTVPSP